MHRLDNLKKSAITVLLHLLFTSRKQFASELHSILFSLKFIAWFRIVGLYCIKNKVQMDLIK
jgi:hypothetical protein